MISRTFHGYVLRIIQSCKLRSWWTNEFFASIYDILTISDQKLRADAFNLANLYNVDPDALIAELISFRGQFGGKIFKTFAVFAKFVLTRLSDQTYPLLQFFTQIILILPFATADCERSFSAMNRIKSGERNRLTKC